MVLDVKIFEMNQLHEKKIVYVVLDIIFNLKLMMNHCFQ